MLSPNKSLREHCRFLDLIPMMANFENVAPIPENSDGEIELECGIENNALLAFDFNYQLTAVFISLIFEP